MAIDPLSNRMKEQYEDRFRIYLPRRSYTIIRIDGKAFHQFTKGLHKPFCEELIAALQITTCKVCDSMDSVCFAYAQSDEISFLLTDFERPQTQAWFNGNLQKIASVSASLFTAHFNSVWKEINGKLGLFDAQAFSIADEVEVENYFLWRQKDWNRNSIQMLARAHYSQAKLHGKRAPEIHELLYKKGLNWAELPPHLKNGSLITKEGERGFVAKGAFTFDGAGRPQLTALIPRRWANDDNGE